MTSWRLWGGGSAGRGRSGKRRGFHLAESSGALSSPWGQGWGKSWLALSCLLDFRGWNLQPYPNLEFLLNANAKEVK